MTDKNGGVIALTGAGISTGSGIPDFRGPRGVWTVDPDAVRLLDAAYYFTDWDIRRRTWAMWASSPVWSARPTTAHLALAAAQRGGAVGAIATQNFDGLHQAAGSTRVLELHGSLPGSHCRSCGHRLVTTHLLAHLDADPDPHCPRCGGIVATDVVMFGESLPEDVLDAAIWAAADCTELWAIGTTLSVHPAAGLVPVALDHGARLVIVNAEPTPYDRLADEVIREPIDDAVPGLVDRALRRHDSRRPTHPGEGATHVAEAPW